VEFGIVFEHRLKALQKLRFQWPTEERVGADSVSNNLKCISNILFCILNYNHTFAIPK